MKNELKEQLEKQSFIERIFEKGLWNIRFIVLLAVLFSILAAISLFIIGSWEIVDSIMHKNPITNLGKEVGVGGDNVIIKDHFPLLLKLISAIDLYLIGVVLLIFGFGLYELFISKIDIARKDESVTILEIDNLDELKSKLINVIIMVLIISFFERILENAKSFNSPQDMMFFAASILALSVGVYFIRIPKKKEK